jgi:hypothetical protein
VAREVDLLQAGGVEPAAEPFAQSIGLHRRVETRQVDDVDSTPGGQGTEQRRPPSPRAGQAVNEHERLAAAGDAVANCAAVDLDLPKLDVSFAGFVHLIQSGRCLCEPTRRQLSRR